MRNEQATGPDEPGEQPKIELRPTADGSPTLYRPDLHEHYHSTHGARQESAHVFIEAGLRPLLARGWGQADNGRLRILEVGLILIQKEGIH